MSDAHDTQDQLRRLARSQRILAGAVVFLAAGLLAAWTRPPQETDLVRARRIQLVDTSGRIRMELRHDTVETGLFIIDDAGDTRIGVAQFAHGGGGVALHGPRARGAAVLYLKGDGHLTFYDSTGAVVARLPQ